MTLVYASRYGDELIFLGDSAVTSGVARSEATHTSFGQLQHRDGVAIEEGALKLIALPPFLLAFAGDVEGGREFINYIDRHRAGRSPSEILERSTVDVLETGRKDGYTVIVGFVEGGRARLWYLTTDGVVVPEVPGFCGAGLAATRFAPGLGAVLAMAASRNEDALLAIERAASQFQWEAASEDVLGRYKTGGAFIGAVLRADGNVEWQRDTAYVLYESGHMRDSEHATREGRPPPYREPWVTSVAARASAILIRNASHDVPPHALAWNAPSDADLREIVSAFHIIRHFHVETYAFICVDAPTIVIVRCHRAGETCHAFHYTCDLASANLHILPTDQMLGCLTSTRQGTHHGVDGTGAAYSIPCPFAFVIGPPPPNPETDWLAWHDKTARRHRLGQ